MEISLIIIFGLVNFRLSKMLKDEDGLLGVFIWLRMFIGIEYYCDGNKLETIEEYRNVTDLGVNIDTSPRNEIARLFSCLWCLSVWVGFWLSLVFFFLDIQKVFMFALASSTIAIIIDRYIEG